MLTPISDNDVATIVSGGVTLHEALKAAKLLSAKGKPVRVIDVFTVKPLDWQTILHHSTQTHNRIITVEDHYPEGGISEAVASSLLINAPNHQFKLVKLCVNSIPFSGQPNELMERFGIDAKSIVAAVENF